MIRKIIKKIIDMFIPKFEVSFRTFARAQELYLAYTFACAMLAFAFAIILKMFNLNPPLNPISFKDEFAEMNELQEINALVRNGEILGSAYLIFLVNFRNALIRAMLAPVILGIGLHAFSVFMNLSFVLSVFMSLPLSIASELAPHGAIIGFLEFISYSSITASFWYAGSAIIRHKGERLRVLRTVTPWVLLAVAASAVLLFFSALYEALVLYWEINHILPKVVSNV